MMIQRFLLLVALSFSVAACASGSGGNTNPSEFPQPQLPPDPVNGEGSDGDNDQTTGPSPSPIPSFLFSDGTRITNTGTGTPSTTAPLCRTHQPSTRCLRNDGNFGIKLEHPSIYIPRITVNYNTQTYDAINVSGLDDAHAAGWTGKGVDVAVIETGNLADYGYHGLSVAGIVKLIAPEATYHGNDGMDFTTGTDYHSFFTTTTARFLSSNIEVANHSYGHYQDITPNYQILEPLFARGFVNDYNDMLRYGSNALHVFSAGNNGSEQHFSSSGYPSYCIERGGRKTHDSCTANKWLYDANVNMDRTIFVGSVDNNNNLNDYSASAGPRGKRDFIVADGDSPFDEARGTSFAAPRVSGAAALVIHKFDTNAVNTKQILLQTADDLGAPGVDDVFGHGRLNLGRALSPVGTLR